MWPKIHVIQRKEAILRLKLNPSSAVSDLISQTYIICSICSIEYLSQTLQIPQNVKSVIEI